MRFINNHFILFLKHPSILWTYLKIKWFRNVLRVKQRFCWDRYFERIRDPKTKTMLIDSYENSAVIIKQLEQHGFSIKNFEISPDEYREYLKKARYQDYILYLNGSRSAIFAEKSLEHFVAARLLDLKPSDIYIDIANACSPTVEIYHRLFGCTTYRQDLTFPQGVRDNIIGSDATCMPLADGFCNKMAMHCSFEHFENDSDSRFIKEAARVLAHGGKMCILPLYLFTQYVIRSNPVIIPDRGVPFESDALISCNKGFLQRHSRFYDVAHLVTRIKAYLSGMSLTIYHITNPKDISTSCYLTFAAVFEKKAADKPNGFSR